MVLTETSSTCYWASGGVWPWQHRWRRSVLYPEWWSWKHMEIWSRTEEYSIQPAQKRPWLWTRWVSGMKNFVHTNYCKSNEFRKSSNFCLVFHQSQWSWMTAVSWSMCVTIRTITAVVVWLYAVWMEGSLCRWRSWCLITHWKILLLQLEL